MSRMSLVSEAAKAMMAAETAAPGVAQNTAYVAPPPQAPTPSPPDPTAAVALRLSQIAFRAAFSAVLGALFPLLALGSALFLWHSVLGAPSTNQLVGLGLYGLLLLSLESLRRRASTSNPRT